MLYWLTGVPELIDLALLLLRLIIGVMFLLSGYFKLTDPDRRAKMAKSLQTGGFPTGLAVPLSAIELLGGLALILGLLTALAAALLIALTVVALVTVAVKQIKGTGIHWLEDLLYLPETLLIGALLVLLATGAGGWSLDRAL